jgi:hypothetical protein
MFFFKQLHAIHMHNLVIADEKLNKINKMT